MVEVAFFRALAGAVLVAAAPAEALGGLGRCAGGAVCSGRGPGLHREGVGRSGGQLQSYPCPRCWAAAGDGFDPERESEAERRARMEQVPRWNPMEKEKGNGADGGQQRGEVVRGERGRAARDGVRRSHCARRSVANRGVVAFPHPARPCAY